MLDFMRKNANSWVMILLFGIIIFVFAINFGPWAGGSMTSVPYAVIVNNEAISMAEFRTAYASQFARIKQFRPDYDQAQADKDGLKQMVIDQMIYRELLTQLGHKYQLSVGARTLAEEIKERVFGEKEAFNKEEYVQRIHNYFQTSVSQFEQQVAKEMVAHQMATILGSSVYVSDDEVKTSYKDKNTKIALEFVKVDPSYFKSSTPIPPEEMKHFQEEHSEEMTKYYNEHISNYVKEAEIRASHILIKVPPAATADEKKALKEKAEKILTRVKDNGDFAEIAKAESDDTVSKASGGDLNFFSEGMMVEEFSKAAFALKPGEISNVIESPFGFHIIKQTDQKPKVEKKLDDVKTEIAELLIRKEEQNSKARELAQSALLELKKGASLANIAKNGVIQLKTAQKTASDSQAPLAAETELFTSTMPFVPNIGRTASLNSEVFALTKENPTPKEVIETNGAYFAFRLKSKEEPDMAKFEEQKTSVKMSLLYPRKRAMTQQYLNQMKENATIKFNPALMAGASTDI